MDPHPMDRRWKIVFRDGSFKDVRVGTDLSGSTVSIELDGNQDSRECSYCLAMYHLVLRGIQDLFVGQVLGRGAEMLVDVEKLEDYAKQFEVWIREKQGEGPDGG
jgi:hypothetical protein